jgi:mRNA interferase MazF
MARGVIARGDIWMALFAPPNKQRPVVILSRPVALELLDWAIVVPITTTIHGVPSEVVLGPEHGLKNACAANLDNVQSIRKERLKHYVGHLDEAHMRRVCQALSVATGCGSTAPGVTAS